MPITSVQKSTKSLNIFLISNMYPSQDQPTYGIFVKKTKEYLEDQGAVFNNCAIISGRGYTIFQKIVKYSIFYFEIFYYGLKQNHDIVYAHHFSFAAPALLLLRLFFRRPLVLNAHGHDIIPKTRIQHVFFWIGKLLAKDANLLILPSNFFKNKALSSFTIDPKKTWIYPSGGIDVKTFTQGDKEKAKKEYGFSDEIVLCYVSRIDPGKGWELLLRAMSNLMGKEENKRVRALFAGDGTDVTSFQKLIIELNLQKQIEYLGAVPNDKLPMVYSAADVFIFPSLLEESLGLVGLEAMACGLPVIASNIGALPEYVFPGKNGLLFEPGNIVELTEKINTFLSYSDEEKCRMSQEAVLTSKEYECVYHAKKLLSHLDSVR